MLLTFTVLLWIATAIKGVQLLRAPDDRLLRTVAGGLAAAAVAFTVGRYPVEEWLDGMVLGSPSLIRNFGMSAAFYSVLAFFVYSTKRQRRAAQEMRRHHAVIGTLLALALITWSTAPDHVRVDPHGAAGVGLLQGTAFQLLVVIALLYAIVGALRRALHYARHAQRKHLRIGLRILVVGLAGALVANLISAAMTLMGLGLPPDDSVMATVRTAYVIVILVAIPGLAIGLAYPIVAGMAAAAPVWWRHWWEYRALRPLWQEMHHAFPDLTLRRTIGAVRPWSIHARRYRRACEIRDGLVMLAPYYPVTGHHRQATVATVDTYAEQVREALRARAEAREDGSEPVGGPVAVPVPQSGFGDEMNGDIEWLVSLSRALHQAQESGSD